MIAVLTLLIACSKQQQTQPASEKMNGIEFTAKYKIELPFLDYSITTNGSARSSKAKAHQAQLTVTEDLTISGSVECTVSPNAQWGGIQRFFTFPITSDSATSYCNFSWNRVNSFPATMVCPTTTAGWYRGWTSDAAASATAYDIHLSALLQKD